MVPGDPGEKNRNFHKILFGLARGYAIFIERFENT
jgi:hypothetical protein